MKKGYRKILIVLSVLLVMVLGVSFAYFLSSVIFSGNGAGTSASTTTKIENATVEVEGSLDFNDLDILPGHKNISSIKVTATGDGETILYNLIWKGTNTLNTSLNYTIYRTEELIEVEPICSKKTEPIGSSSIHYEECEISNIDNLGDIIGTGSISTTPEETNFKLVPDENIVASETGTVYYYYIILEYPNKDESQNIDIGGSFNGEFTIEESDADYLLAVGSNWQNTSSFLGSRATREEFESVTTLDSINIPESGVIESYDVSIRRDKSIMAWYTDTDSDKLYELYIGQEGGVIANPNSSHLFRNMTNVYQLMLII